MNPRTRDRRIVARFSRLEVAKFPFTLRRGTAISFARNDQALVRSSVGINLTATAKQCVSNDDEDDADDGSNLTPRWRAAVHRAGRRARVHASRVHLPRNRLWLDDPSNCTVHRDIMSAIVRRMHR